MNHFENIDTWIFDLDETLYSRDAGFMKQCNDLYIAQIARKNDISIKDAWALYNNLYETCVYAPEDYKAQTKFDVDEWLAEVMKLDHTVIDVCPESPKLIHELKGTKILCSNAPDSHISRMLTHLGMADVFDIICDTTTSQYSKPHPQVYMDAVKKHNIDPSKCVMIDDRAVNLKPAHDLGMMTVLIHDKSHLLHVDFSYDTLIDFLREVTK